jgi:hypothetical protein
MLTEKGAIFRRKRLYAESPGTLHILTLQGSEFLQKLDINHGVKRNQWHGGSSVLCNIRRCIAVYKTLKSLAFLYLCPQLDTFTVFAIPLVDSHRYEGSKVRFLWNPDRDHCWDWVRPPMYSNLTREAKQKRERVKCKPEELKLITEAEYMLASSSR